MAVAELLHDLEQHDSELERLQHDRVDTEHRLMQNRELQEAESRAERLRIEDGKAQHTQRSLEGDLAALESRIQRTHSRLYGGTVVDPRELGSLERELEHARGERDAIEERLLNAMEEAERLAKERSAAQDHAAALRDRWESEKPALQHHERELMERVARVKAERDALAASIDPRTLAQYERLRSHLGHAVAVATNGVCSMCRVNLPPKDVQHVRSGALVTCSNCGRILFAGG